MSHKFVKINKNHIRELRVRWDLRIQLLRSGIRCRNRVCEGGIWTKVKFKICFLASHPWQDNLKKCRSEAAFEEQVYHRYFIWGCKICLLSLNQNLWPSQSHHNFANHFIISFVGVDCQSSSASTSTASNSDIVHVTAPGPDRIRQQRKPFWGNWIFVVVVVVVVDTFLDEITYLN